MRTTFAVCRLRTVEAEGISFEVADHYFGVEVSPSSVSALQLLALVNTINSESFCGYPPGTVMLFGLEWNDARVRIEYWYNPYRFDYVLITKTRKKRISFYPKVDLRWTYPRRFRGLRLRGRKS